MTRPGWVGSLEWRAEVARSVQGKTIETLEWEPEDGGYWVMTFTDGSEITFHRSMAEVTAGGRAVAACGCYACPQHSHGKDTP